MTKDGSILKKINEMDSQEDIFPKTYTLRCMRSNKQFYFFDDLLYTMNGRPLFLVDISNEILDNIAITKILDNELYPEYFI